MYEYQVFPVLGGWTLTISVPCQAKSGLSMWPPTKALETLQSLITLHQMPYT